jgi:CHAT domain-containing protein
MTKSTVTRKAALTAGIIALDYFNMENIRPDSMGDLDYAEAIQVLVKMVEQVSKPRKAVVSKARKINENLAAEVCKHIPAEGLTSKEIVALGLPEITTTQKAAAVMRVAEELGLASKVKEGKNIRYVIATADDAAEDE